MEYLQTKVSPSEKGNLTYLKGTSVFSERHMRRHHGCCELILIDKLLR